MTAALTFLPFVTSGAVTTLDGARLPRLRAAARLAVARRAAQAGQEQPAGALARLHRLRRHRADADLLVFIGEAVRDAFDPRKMFARGGAGRPRAARIVEIGAARSTARSRRPPQPSRATRCSRVDDLQVRFGAGRRRRRRRARRLVRARARRDAGAGRRERLGQIGDGAVDPAAAALPAARSHPERQHPLSTDAELHRRAARARCAQIRGDRIAMIFQEPMTSLNPLHTRRAADRRDAGRCTSGLDRRRRRARARSSCCASSASPIPSGGSAPTRTSSPAASASA